MDNPRREYARVPVGGWFVTTHDDGGPQLWRKMEHQSDVRWITYEGRLVPPEDREPERGPFASSITIYALSVERAEASIMLAHHKPTAEAWHRFVMRQVT